MQRLSLSLTHCTCYNVKFMWLSRLNGYVPLSPLAVMSSLQCTLHKSRYASARETVHKCSVQYNRNTTR